MSIADLDFTQELKALNDLFVTNSEKIQLPFDGVSDGLSEDFTRLMKSGKVYWASVVQTDAAKDSKLFNSKKNAPPVRAAVVYNHARAETENSDAIILRSFSRYLYSFKGKSPDEIPEHLKEAVKALSDEAGDYRVRLKTGEDGDFGMNVTLQTITVFPSVLPKGILKDALLPIIAAPKKCASVIPLPFFLWTKGFERYYNKARAL